MAYSQIVSCFSNAAGGVLVERAAHFHPVVPACAPSRARKTENFPPLVPERYC
jgi:hypothetical protein